jgi:hypothetical protein
LHVPLLVLELTTGTAEVLLDSVINYSVLLLFRAVALCYGDRHERSVGYTVYSGMRLGSMVMNPMIIVATAVVVIGVTGAVMYWVASQHDKNKASHH